MEESFAIAGGRILYLDCKEPLIPYYENQGYAVLCHDAETGLYKLFKCIDVIGGVLDKSDLMGPVGQDLT